MREVAGAMVEDEARRNAVMEERRARHEVYQIVLKGHLDEEWSEWFAGLTVTRADNGETILTGPVVDQAALHGVLMKVRDLGLPLLALTRIDPSTVGNSTAAILSGPDDLREERR
jgi:hypothetical protein